MSRLVGQMNCSYVIQILLQVVHTSDPRKFVLLIEAGNGVFLRVVDAAESICISMFGTLGRGETHIIIIIY